MTSACSTRGTQLSPPLLEEESESALPTQQWELLILNGTADRCQALTGRAAGARGKRGTPEGRMGPGSCGAPGRGFSERTGLRVGSQPAPCRPTCARPARVAAAMGTGGGGAERPPGGGKRAGAGRREARPPVRTGGERKCESISSIQKSYL